MNYEKRQASIAKRLLKYSAQPDANGCIHWTGYTDKNGYGLLQVEFETFGKPVRAHRLSYEQKNGSISEGLWVLHKCDNPSCINPDHLFLGTPKDNVQDMMMKKRNKPGRRGMKGSDNANAKLSFVDIVAIREAGKFANRKQIASKYKINVSTVNRIISRKSWSHV